jgi:membrane fusion protein (multidrug efflux system)
LIKRLLIVLALLALAFGSVFGWRYWQMRQQAAASGPPPAAVVSTRTVTSEQWEPTLRAVGSMTPTRGVVVAAEVPGVVREIHFESGNHVEAGDLLVELDDDVDLAELEALQADRKLAEITRDRIRRVVSDNLASRSDFDEAQAELDRAEAQIAAKRAMIRKKAIRAPFEGELGIRQVNPGAFLGAGDPVVELVDLDPIYAEYSLPERFLAQIENGQRVTLRVQAHPDTVFEGVIDAISPSVQAASRSVRIRALVDNPERLLRPGMFAEVETHLPVKNDVLTLPERAVTYNPYGESVFVVEDSGGSKTVTLTQIETGGVRDGRVEILGGLEEGAEIVSDGHNKLRNGQPVTIDNSVDPDAQDPRS